MTIDLTRTLHDTVDGGAGGHADETGIGIDLATLTTRVRRRRTRRAVVRGAVGAGAAGAFAFAGVQVVGRRGPDDVLPAANPSAAPGTCGSDIGELTVSSTNEAFLAVASPTASETTPTEETFGADPQPLAGRSLTATLHEVPRGAVADTAVGVSRIVATDAEGTVVGRQVVPSPEVGNAVILMDPASGAVQTVVTLGDVLTVCAPGLDAGSTPLPDGVYALYALSAPTAAGTPEILGGPWGLGLEPALSALTDLPSDYPAAEVPVVGESVVTAVATRGSNPGWLVQTETDSVGALDAAVNALVAAGGRSVDTMTMSADQLTTLVVNKSQVVTTANWEVALRQVTDEEGKTLLQYQLEPR
ncbi:hypothetical protein [Cellulomonas soli]|uniref:Uncharacterized protein n=1 Tax=Cellulomonas soli TaxID=931535 RepID=A0A512PGB9_9CELL|nr:hypothetical protein [Cellulomonas soli]NYI58115.1 hypothetical protein [Cellulomonas soli]GEP70249.1 hypothetical protein CSO01_29640 [Cellulomonas soli]